MTGKAFVRVICAWLLAQITASALLVVASNILLDSNTSSAVRLHVYVAAAAAGVVFSCGATLLKWLGAKTWLAAVILGGLSTIFLLGVPDGVDFFEHNVSDQLIMLGAVILPFGLTALATSFVYSLTLNKMAAASSVRAV